MFIRSISYQILSDLLSPFLPGKAHNWACNHGFAPLSVRERQIPYNFRIQSRERDFVKTAQGDHSGWRGRYPAASDHAIAEQTALAGIRQAHDLLPARDPDGGGDPGIHDHHDTAR